MGILGPTTKASIDTLKDRHIMSEKSKNEEVNIKDHADPCFRNQGCYTEWVPEGQTIHQKYYKEVFIN